MIEWSRGEVLRFIGFGIYIFVGTRREKNNFGATGRNAEDEEQR